MAKFRRNATDYSKKSDNNPTALLERESERLRKIEDVCLLKEEMTKIVEGSSISKKNLKRFYQALRRATTLEKMQTYLYNFILAGSAMQTKFER